MVGELIDGVVLLDGNVEGLGNVEGALAVECKLSGAVGASVTCGVKETSATPPRHRVTELMVGSRVLSHTATYGGTDKTIVVSRVGSPHAGTIAGCVSLGPSIT